MAIDIDIEAVAVVARRARAVLDAYSKDCCDPMFQGFPLGTCGPTAELLCRYLIEYKGLDARYVSAELDDGSSHARVIVEGIVVDITADQFDAPAVIVARDSEWHSRLIAEEPRLPCVKLEQWPCYPTQAWDALVAGMRATTDR